MNSRHDVWVTALENRGFKIASIGGNHTKMTQCGIPHYLVSDHFLYRQVEGSGTITKVPESICQKLYDEGKTLLEN